MKRTLSLLPINRVAFSCLPAREVQLDDDRINVTGADCSLTLPGDSGVGGSGHLWVIGNEFGALGAVVARHEQDAFDQLCDCGFSDGLIVDEPETEEEREGLAFLGNAGEPHDLTNAWIQQVRIDPALDIELIVALARADGAGVNTLDKV